MRFLRQNTAVRITVGPFFDKTDGVTPETSLTVTNCKLTLMVDDDDGTAANLIIDAAATASGGNNDMVHVTNDDAGFYDLELTAAQTNYVGRAMLAITDAANHCPVFHEFMIVPTNVYDSLFGTDKLQVDSVEISSDSGAADNLEAACDGNTYNVGGVAVVAASVTAAVALAASQPNYAPAKAGDAMTLADDAITAAKFYESTAYPLKSADTGATAVARTGADSDTLETLSDQIDAEAIKTTAIKAKTDAMPAILV